MKALIQNEKIRIDNHYSGIPFEWNSNQDIHLDKISYIRYKGMPVSVKVRIPLNSDKQLTFDTSLKLKTTEQTQLQNAMIKEIREAFESPKNYKNRDNFLKALIEQINLLNQSGESSIYLRTKVQEVFNRIMSCFNLDAAVENVMTNVANAYFQRYCDSSDDSKLFYVYADSATTEIGEFTQREELEYQNKNFEF